MATTPRAKAAPKPDAVGVAAVDLARAAAEEVAPPGTVGDHVGSAAEDERVVTHSFVCLDPGYVGWRWSVTVARPPRARTVTVDEVVLLPGDDSLLAPAWVPWSERVRPGDLGVGDVLPTSADDPRLVAGFSGEGDLETVYAPGPVQPTQWELGLGRLRVLSPLGREEAAARWAEGGQGGDSPLANAAPARCASCGFLLTIGGPLGQAFGICANEMSPSDGRAVTLDHGCGAHSEADNGGSLVADSGDPIHDHLGYDVIDLGGA